MKKRSKAFQEGYDYAYMLGRDDTKEIKEYFKQFDMNPYTKKYEDLDLWEYNPYEDPEHVGTGTSKQQIKQQMDFDNGLQCAIQEMRNFNYKIDEFDSPKEWLYDDSAWDLIYTMQDFLKYADGDKKKLQKYIDTYIKGLEAERKFFEEIQLKQPFEIGE